MCEMWDFRRGFPQKVQDTKELIKIIRLHRDLIAKQPYLLPPWSDPGWSIQGQSEAPGDLNRRHSGGLGIRLWCKTERGTEGIAMVFSPVVEDDGDGQISGLTAPAVELGVAKSLATWASKGSGECAQEAKEEQRDAWKCSPALGRCSVGRNFAGGRPLWRWSAAGPHSGGSAPVCLRRLGAAEEVRLGKTKPVVASARSGINGGGRMVVAVGDLVLRRAARCCTGERDVGDDDD
jgi:hypothetical protein